MQFHLFQMQAGGLILVKVPILLLVLWILEVRYFLAVSLYDTNTTFNGKSVGDFNTLTTPSDNFKDKVREIFQEISNSSPLNTFKEVQESTNGTDFTAGQIRIMLMDSGSGGTLGSAFAPNPAYMPPDDETANYYVGDIYINNIFNQLF